MRVRRVNSQRQEHDNDASALSLGRECRVDGSEAGLHTDSSCPRDMSEDESSESTDALDKDAEESERSNVKVKAVARCTQASTLIARILESSDVPLGPCHRPVCSSSACHSPIDEATEGSLPQDATSRDSAYIGCYVWKKFEITRSARLAQLVCKHLLGRVVSRVGDPADPALLAPRFWIIFSDEQAMCMPVSEIRQIVRTRALGRTWSLGMEKQARQLDHFMREDNIRYRNLRKVQGRI